METFENVVLLSSGIDSVVSALIVEKEYKKTPYLITMDMGFNFREVEATNRIVDFLGWKDRHTVFNTRELLTQFLQPANNNYIPYRNMLFVTWADMLMQKMEKYYVKYYLGGLREDKIADNSVWGRRMIQNTLNELREEGEVVVTSKISEMSKPDLIKWIECNRGSDFLHDLLPLLNPCYIGDKCGECNACMRYFFALTSVGIKYSECMFESNPATSDKILEYVKRIKGGLRDSKMEENRFNYTKEVLKELNLI